MANRKKPEGRTKLPARRRSRRGRDALIPRQLGMDNEEVASVVCTYLCRGYTPAEIAALMATRHGIKMTREAPYKFINYAASRNWLQFIGPREDYLSQKMREYFPWLQQVEVVHTGVVDDVAYRTAVMVVELLRARAKLLDKEEVHIGFAGGYSMRTVAEKLAALLKQSTDPLPRKIVLHALVAGFDVETSVTDPNAFFTYFMTPEKSAQEKADKEDRRIAFVALHAPALVESGRMNELLTWPGIKAAYNRVKELDIIVTSAGSIQDEDNMLRKYYRVGDDDLSDDLNQIGTRLIEDGCVGDMLWLPLAKRGPMDNTRYRYRAMTLINLEELPRYIERGTQIVLTLGACTLCQRTKEDILHTILHLEEQLITHLVVDSRTVRELLKKPSGT
jgi:hypothetical protein